MNWRVLCAGVACVVALAGCATGGAAPRVLSEKHTQVLAYAGTPVRSITLLTVRDFETLDDETVLLWERPTRAYLLTVDRPCLDLPSAHTIGLVRHEPWLNAGTDALQVRDQRCIIREIRPVDGKALKAARKQARADAKRDS